MMVIRKKIQTMSIRRDHFELYNRRVAVININGYCDSNNVTERELVMNQPALENT